jgi:hypothetical protein
MSEEMSSHPLLTYLTFILPAILLVIALIVGAGIGYIIAILTLLGIVFILFFLPIETDNGSSGS